MSNENTKDAYMRARHKKNNNSKNVNDVSARQEDDKDATKVQTYDYERESIKESKRHEVVNTISGLIEINLDELEVFDTSQQINEILTEQVKQSLKASNFLTLAKSIIRASLLQETIAVRISGTLIAPELYIYDNGVIFNSSKGNEDYIEFFQGSFTRHFGSGSGLVQEFYDFFGDNMNIETKKLEKGVFTSSLQRGMGFKQYNPIIQRRSEIWPNQLPIIIFQPILDERGNATTIFQHKDYGFDYIDSAHSKLQTYLDNYNFHILPNANLLDKDENGKNINLKQKFKNVILPFKKKNMTQDETVFEAFDPQLQNVQTAFSVFKDINNYFFSTFGIQRPDLEATKQKSVFEAELDKQEEKTLVNNLTRYYEAKMTKILENYYLPSGFKVRFNFKGFEIKDKLNDAKAEEVEIKNNKSKDKKGEVK